MEKVKDAIIRELNREEPSVALPSFVLSMSAIITNFAAQVLKRDVAEVAMTRESVNETTLMDVMSGYDMLRHFIVHGQVGAFLLWLLEQDVSDDDERAWYETAYIGKKWNEWVKGGREHGKKET